MIKEQTTKEIEVKKLGYALGYAMRSSPVRSQEGFIRRMQKFLADCEITLNREEAALFNCGFWEAYGSDRN